MPQALGRIKETILKNTGDPWVGINFELRRQGATVNGDQSGASPLTVAVHDLGGIVDGDVVAIDEGTAQLSVSAVSIANKTVELSGFVGTLSVDDGSRITPIGSLPVVYLDLALANSGTNPLITDSKGDVLSNASDVAYAPYGSYDYLLSGDDQDGNAITTELVRDFWVSAISPFDDGGSASRGIRIDNVTNDGVSLNNALADLNRTVAGGQGGTLELGKGTILTLVPIVLYTKQRLIGASRGATIIKADAAMTFNGTTDALGRLGDGSSNIHGGRFENITFDCDSIANSIGGFSNKCDEISGFFNCSFSNYMVYGIFMNGAAAENWVIDQCEFYHGASAAAVGISVVSCANRQLISNVTVNAYDQATTADAGIRINSANCTVINPHFEFVTHGIDVTGTTPSVYILSPHATAPVTNLVRLNTTGGISVFNIKQGGATNAINDGSADGGGAISLPDGAFFIHTNDGASPSSFKITSSATAASRWVGPFTFIGALTASSTVALSGVVTGSGSAALAGSFAGSPTFTATPLFSGTLDLSGRIRLQSFENIAIATSISVVKNNVRITGNGPVTLSTIQIDGGAPGAAHDGMEVTILLSLASTSTYTIDQGGNILLEAGATIGLTAGQMATFKWVNAESKWFQTSPKAAH